MFDINNKEALRKAINNRNENSFVIPLYILSDNHRYAIWEINEIQNFSVNTFKIGFGSSIGLKVKTPMLSQYLFDFNTILIDKYFDYDDNVEYTYFVFESGYMSEEEMDVSSMHTEIGMYVESIGEYVQKIVSEYKNKIHEEMLSDKDAYID
jgi:hypothetical protein